MLPDPRQSPIISNALAGCVATIPMSVMMLALHRALPPTQRHPLPPAQITHNLAEQLPPDVQPNETEQRWLTVIAHFGYGALAGACYTPFARMLPLSPLVKGIAFGMAVWAGSYLGLLPVTGLLPSHSERPPERTALLIISHIVWGSALGLIAQQLQTGMGQRSS